MGLVSWLARRSRVSPTINTTAEEGSPSLRAGSSRLVPISSRRLPRARSLRRLSLKLSLARALGGHRGESEYWRARTEEMQRLLQAMEPRSGLATRVAAPARVASAARAPVGARSRIPEVLDDNESAPKELPLGPDHVEQAIKRAQKCGKSAPPKSRDPSKDSGGQNVHAGWSASGWIAGVGSINSMISEALLQPVSSGATLPGETAQLDFIRSLGREDAAVGKAAVLQLLLRSPLIVRMADAVWDEAHTLAGQAAATAVELHSKFADDGAFTLRYGGMETFFGGLEKLLGSPSANLLEAMNREHCKMPDSQISFRTPNYHVDTTCEIEWWFVHDPERGLHELKIPHWPVEQRIEPSHKRIASSLAHFEAEWSAIDDALDKRKIDKLKEAEVVGARLYTGPMYHKVTGSHRLAPHALPPHALRTPSRSHRRSNLIGVNVNVRLPHLHADLPRNVDW